MKRMQRTHGFGLIELAITLAIVATVSALAWAVHGWWVDFTEGLREEGRVEIRLQVSTRDNEKLIAAQARIRELENAARFEEQRRVAAVAAAVHLHVKELNDEKSKLEDLRAHVRDGTLVLRDPGAEAGGRCPGGGGSGGGEVAADPARSAGRVGGGELSGRAADFLLTEAGRADAALAKLRLCRATLKAERTALQ